MPTTASAEPSCLPADAEREGSPSRIRVFVSFDVEYEGDLYERFLAEAASSEARIEVVGCSERATTDRVWSESARGRIQEADQLIVLCGEHTDESMCVSSELLIARAEHVPYTLLWGRRGHMCKKPLEAEASEAMYSWTPQILRARVEFVRRNAAADAEQAAAARTRALDEAARVAVSDPLP